MTEGTVHQFRSGLVANRPKVPEIDAWRLPFLKRLLEERANDCIETLDGGEQEERKAWAKRRQELIDSLCS